MTKKEALEETVRMWTYIAENRCLSKVEYEDCLQWVNNCPLCEVSPQGCVECPMRGSWGPGKLNYCQEEGSFYLKWADSKDPHWARAIASTAQDLLDMEVYDD